VCFVPFGLDHFSHAPPDPARPAEQAVLLEALGVTWLTIVLHTDTRREFCQAADRFVSALARGR
jgi:hypothetical protein